jgi:amino acid transporter
VSLLEASVTPNPSTEPAHRSAQFGTFTGVFTPTLLTILGVIMYVRIGWVVGNAGLGGALLIMALGLGITLCTGLSLSSIATNTRLGAGGPYAIVRRSLGLEVAGSVGIPLYLTRPLGIAMYVFGFREGWQWIFPNHPALVIDLVVFAALFAIAYRSADLAFRVQYLIMAVIGGSLISIFAGSPTTTPVAETVWWGTYPGFPERGFQGVDFWVVFAVFFPATTGILAGANMSGDLADPRRAIPVGTLWAIGLSAVIYVGVAWWASRAGSMEELATNYNLIIDRAAFPSLVLAGLLGATFSSALAGLVGGPRILMAMGENKLLPYSSWISATDADGEPRNASRITGLLTLACLMVRDLNLVAPLVTMFFLITYCIINVVVLFEQGLGLVSFRPALRIPLWVPLFGTVGSLFAMFIVNATFGLLAMGMVAAIYLWIDRFVTIEEGSTDEARSSLFVALAEFAAHHASRSPHQSLRAWKPSLLVPVEEPEDVRGSFDLICDAALPEGSVKLLALATKMSAEELTPRIEALHRAFGERRLYTTWSMIDTAEAEQGVSTGLQALQSALFRPNLLCLTMHEDDARDDETRRLIALARRTGVGAFLVARHPKAGLGNRRIVTLWVRVPPTPATPVDAFEQGSNLNLTLLMGYRLKRQWRCRLRIVAVVDDADDRGRAEHFLEEMCDLARIPKDAERRVMLGSLDDVVGSLTGSDLGIFGLQPDPDFAFVRRMVQLSRSTCLFVVDSGRESALV